MKKVLLLLSVLLISNFSNADVLQKLKIVNQEWQHVQFAPAILNEVKIDDVNSNQAIQTHLSLVIQTLQNRNVAHLNIRQQQNRSRLLEVLKVYAQQNTFPINNNLIQRRNPIFIDEVGTHCAVGYLMQQSGHDELAQLINKNERFTYVKDIKTFGVSEWANEFGFTIQELAWIQPAYPLSTAVSSVASGVDGVVNTICPIDATTFLIGGKFTKEFAGNVTCNNIAMVTKTNNTWQISPLLNGVNDEVKIIYKNGNDIIVGGKFTQANGLAANHICMIKLASSVQMYWPMGSLDNTVNDIEIFDGSIYAGGKFTDLLSKWNGTSWVNAGNGMIYGNQVNALHLYDTIMVVGGDFELATGALRTNIASFTKSYGLTLYGGFGTKQIINDFETLNDTLYAAGEFVAMGDTTAVYFYNNGDWQSLVKESQVGSIKDLSLRNGKLLAGGSFVMGGLMYSGKHFGEVAKYPNFSVLSPILDVDQEVNSAIQFNGETIVGGAFTNHSGMTTVNVNRLARIGNGPLSIKKMQNNKIEIFPNPTKAFLSVDVINKTAYAITDIKGAVLATGQVENKRINTEQLPNGNYILNIEGQGAVQFIKQD